MKVSRDDFADSLRRFCGRGGGGFGKTLVHKWHAGPVLLQAATLGTSCRVSTTPLSIINCTSNTDFCKAHRHQDIAATFSSLNLSHLPSTVESFYPSCLPPDRICLASMRTRAQTWSTPPQRPHGFLPEICQPLPAACVKLNKCTSLQGGRCGCNCT